MQGRNYLAIVTFVTRVTCKTKPRLLLFLCLMRRIRKLKTLKPKDSLYISYSEISYYKMNHIN